jgi:hypothetical protein
MTMCLELAHLEEPVLQFGPGHEARAPKEGLLGGGPYDLRLGRAHRSEVRVGLVGPPRAIAEMRIFIERLQGQLRSDRANLALFPDYPGFESGFRSVLATSPDWDARFQSGELQRALERPPGDAFAAAVELYGDGLRDLSRRELRVDVAVCCLPDDLLARCRMVDARLPPAQARALREEERRRASGQVQLFDPAAVSGEPRSLDEAVDPQPQDLLTRNFRSALKARGMEERLPIQLVTSRLWSDDRRGEDPATRAWNLSVALFYKAGGIPWRADMRVDEACFVGISFHHLRTQTKHVVYSSLAQAFSSDGEGFALRGESVPYDEERKRPYLTATKARNLLETVLEAYRERAGRDPARLVVHKTTLFTDEEREGIARAVSSVPTVQLVTLRSEHDFRVLRRGTYPPHRGTLCRIGSSSYLFTSGYQAQHLTYPGPHVPVPIELVGVGDDDADGIARDILCLTKMNWNSARSASALPITLSFARKVGGIMTELRPGVEAHPSFRYYM